MAKFYAVKIGRKPGIYNSWDECKMQVDKFKGAVYKLFSNKEDALMFIEEKKVHFNNGLHMLMVVIMLKLKNMDLVV